MHGPIAPLIVRTNWRAVCPALLLLCLLLSPGSAKAWSSDPTVNTGVATSPEGELDFGSAGLPDGSTVVMWARQNGVPWTSDMYIQRLSEDGSAMWGADGMLLAGGDLIQQAAIVTTDVRGNIFTAWVEQATNGNPHRNTLRLQRLDMEGNLQWPGPGIVVSTTTSLTELPLIAADGQGGVYVGWTDSRKQATEDSTDIYVQHLSKSGRLLWRANGLPVNRAPGHQTLTGLDADGRGGIVVAWRAGWWSSPTHEDTYAQRVSAEGRPGWNPAGVLLWTNQKESFNPKVVSDSRGGAFVIWVDSAIYQIRAQHLLSDGTLAWGTDGVLVASNSGQILRGYVLRRFLNDGFVVGWADARDGRYHSYLQRVDLAGDTRWGEDGLRVAPVSAGSEGLDLQVTPTGATVVAYEDYPTALSSADITAAVFRPDGTRSPGWPEAGIPMSTASGAQRNPKAVATADGVIACWADTRDLLNPDVFAQRVLWSGSVGAPAEPGERGQGRPREHGFILRYARTSSAPYSFELAIPRACVASLRLYDIQGRLVGGSPSDRYEAGRHRVQLDIPADRAARHGLLIATLSVDGAPVAACRFLSGQ